MRGASKRLRVPATLLGLLGLSLGWYASAQERPSFQDSPFLRIDPDKIVLSAQDSRVPCGECHVDEFSVWEQTPHATGFNTLHRSAGAADVLESMNLQVTKRQESLCLRCHYTVDNSLKAIAGVSCESCHGAAADWVDVHNNWGSGVDHPDQETDAHRAQRIQASTDGGMLRPSGDLYAVAANCFECHTVPIEDLVNQGGHTTGSGRFELVEWAGRIRHNYVSAQWESGAENQEPSAGRNRITYTVGRILDYEFGLRGLANATQEGRYAKGMERRISQAFRQLEAVANLQPIPEVVEVLRIGKDLPLLPGNEARLTQAADAIRGQGQAFTSRSDGSELGALDGLISSGRAPVAAEPTSAPEQAQTPPPDQATDPNIQEPAPAPSGDPNILEPAPTPEGAATTAAEPAPAAAATAEFVGVTVGQVRSRPTWIPAPDAAFEVIDPGCSCHGDAEDWWFDDPHQSSHFALVNQQPKAVSIATLYGISTAQMSQGNQICMNCHGMPLSSNPSGQVASGVGCESCHGGSSQYLDVHEDGGNPQLGMRNLKDAATRAANCSRCHLITDDRLLASGHPSGSNYDFAAANTSIQHFPEGRVERSRGRRGESYTPVAAAALSTAYAAERSSRPVPQVQVVEAPPPAARPTPAVGAAAPPAARTGTRVSTTGGSPVAAPPPPPRARPAGRSRAPRPSGQINLTPLPAVADSTAAEDILLLIKNRLQEIRRAVGRRR